MSFNLFLFPPNDSQPRFPLSTIIQQKKAFLLLHQTNKYCWNQTPILKSKQNKSSINHHHLFHLNASSIPGRENQNKHGGNGRPNPTGEFNSVEQQLAKPARSCLFPSRERERQPNRAQPEIDRWTLTSLPGSPSNQTASLRVPRHHPYEKTSSVRKTRMWRRPDHHHQSLLLVYKTLFSTTTTATTFNALSRIILERLNLYK